MFENLSIIYLFGFIGIALIVLVGIILLTKKFNISPKQLTDGIDVTKTISMVIRITAKELNFASDETINKIADLVIDSLDYIKNIVNATTKEEKIQAGIKYVEDNCISFGIELDEDKLFIINTLMTIGINLLESLNKE